MGGRGTKYLQRRKKREGWRKRYPGNTVKRREQGKIHFEATEVEEGRISLALYNKESLCSLWLDFDDAVFQERGK